MDRLTAHRVLAGVALLAALTLFAAPVAAAGGRHGGGHTGHASGHHGGHSRGGGHHHGCCFGRFYAFPFFFPYYPSPAYAYLPPSYYTAPVYAPPVVYTPPPVYTGPAYTPPVSAQQTLQTYEAPNVQREVVYSHGKYVLYGDGVTQPWQWVWVPAAPPPPR
jgi:hypothetical protein